MGSIARRAASKLARLLDRAADPSAAAERVGLYSVAGEYYARSGSGITNKMTGPLAVTPEGWVDGCQIAWKSLSTVTVIPGIVRDSTDVFDLVLAADTDLVITNAGLNGLDAGAEAASTWYAIYLVGDSTRVNPVGTILSTNFTTPTLPAGYDVFRRVGVVRNNAASDFLKFVQHGQSVVRRYYYDESQANRQVLTDGAATVFTTVSLAAFVPPTAREVLMSIGFLAPTVGGATTDVLTVQPTGANEATGPMQFREGILTTAGGLRCSAEMLCSAAQQIDYKVTDADDLANLWVRAFDDEL